MLNYSGLLEKAILFVSSMIIYLSQPDFGVSVAVVLVPVIISGFLSYFDDERVKIILTTGFSVLCCFVPAAVIFMPLIAYDMLFNKFRYINLLAVIPLIHFSKSSSVLVLSIVIIMITFSILIRWHLNMQKQLHRKINELGDEAREMSIKLKKQNIELIEKQDNELYLATLNERNRIARDIHDSVGHLLSSAILQAGALITVSRDEQVKTHLKELNETLSQAMNSIRASVHKIYEESIDLDMQIRELIKKFTFCEVNYDYNMYGDPDKRLKYTFISIIKEALSNVMRHSDATKVTIALNEHPALYQLIIKDNGKAKNTGNGLGLTNMIDRVNSFNGNININTENGFEIFISIPKKTT